MCSNTACVDLTNGTVANGTNIIRIWNYNRPKDSDGSWRALRQAVQRHRRSSGQTKPATTEGGKSFSIRGTVTSDLPLTEVTVGVYDTSGNLKTGRTVDPNTTSYDLRNVDTSVKFGSLGTGGYRYKVTAKTSAGTTTLVNSAFMVLGSGRTVADGTYYIESKNNGYGLRCKRKQQCSGANVVLERRVIQTTQSMYSPIRAMATRKIKNVGSGKYLGVTGQKSASGSNVNRPPGGTRWQRSRMERGSYYASCRNARIRHPWI